MTGAKKAYRRKFSMDLPPDLAVTPEEAGALSWDDRVARMHRLLEVSGRLVERACEIAATDSGPREVAAVAALLSGGNDSTTMAYAMRPYLTHLVFGDTGTGLQVTKDFVRQVAADLGLPLLYVRAPRPEDSYAALVRERGFPGPGMHAKMYQRLKERAFREARRRLVADGRKQRAVFVAGRRRTESKRRANVPEMERESSAMFVSPMVLWTKPDLNTYRKIHAVPVNPVYDMLHLSGECLCGSFAQEGERDWTFRCFPDDPAILELRALEAELADRGDIPAERKIWGCGGQPARCPTGVCNE